MKPKIIIEIDPDTMQVEITQDPRQCALLLGVTVTPESEWDHIRDNYGQSLGRYTTRITDLIIDLRIAGRVKI